MKRHYPICRYTWASKLNDGRLKCRRCGHRYTFQTIWNVCRLPERTKLKLLDYFVLGVPAYRLRFKQIAHFSTIERLFRLIRIALAQHEKLEESFEGVIECDESSFGGHKKGKRGWGARGKIIVLGILKRNGNVKVFPIKGRGTEKILPLVYQNTRPGSLYYTDDWHTYGSLSVRGNHVVVTKNRGCPKGRDHLNGIEGFWSYAKNWLYNYRGVPKKFFHLYLAETSYRFNQRDKDLFPLILNLLRNTSFDRIKRI